MSEPKPPGPVEGPAGQPPPDAEQRVEALVERFLEQLQAGEAPDRPALVAAHPELAPGLERRLALVETMFRVARLARPEGRPGGTPAAERAVPLRCPHCGN